MLSLERSLSFRCARGTLAVLVCALALAGPLTTRAQAAPVSIPTPCQLPVVGTVCDAVGSAASGVATATGAFVMRGVTEWVTDAAVWVTRNVGDVVDGTTSPDLSASWFQDEYSAMLAVAGALALLMLMLAVIQALLRQDAWMLVRAAFGYLPMAFILAGVAVAGTGLLIAITDDISGTVVSSLGGGQATNLLQSVGDAYANALDQSSGIPLFGVFLGAITLAIGAFVLWLELIIRDAAIYICVFFLPLTFVAMIWPATSRWARRLVELLVAIILSKFVIVAILSLATAAITHTTALDGSGHTFERMIAGTALLVLAAWSPFALLSLIPMMEVAAATVGSQRSSISAAAGSAGIHSPASYMRQAMDRSSRPSASQANGGGGTTFAAVAASSARAADRTSETPPSQGRTASVSPPSNGTSSSTGRQAGSASTFEQRVGATSTALRPRPSRATRDGGKR